MKRFQNTLKIALALLLATFSTGFMPVTAAYATGNPGQGGGPAGNNGTIKIGESDASNDDVTNANDPHIIGCNLAVKFFGYDAGARTATVTFDAKDPTDNQLVSPLGAQNVSFTGLGQGGVLDHTETYTLAFKGAPHPTQGYHVKVTVHADGSQGNDTKYKTIWVQGCAPTAAVPGLSVQPVACTNTGTSNGTATATITNTADNTLAAVTYSWTVNSGMTVVASGTTSPVADGATTTVDLTGLAAGAYTMTIIGSDQQTATASFTIAVCQPQVIRKVTPASVTIKDVCDTINDSYTLPPNTDEITYSATKNGLVLTVVATPINGYILDLTGTTGWVLDQATGTATWTYTFTNESCGVLGDNDVCPNITGSQTVIPAGYTKDAQGNCVQPTITGQVLSTSTPTAANELPETLPATGSLNARIFLTILFTALLAYGATYFLQARVTAYRK